MMTTDRRQKRLKRGSLPANVAAPTPRYLMRLSHIDKLINALPITPKSFLEVGPGMGDLSRFLAARFPGIRGHATDISEKSIAIIGQRLREFGNVTVAVSDFTEMAGAERFDLVVACEVFEHLEDDERAFGAVYRLLSPGGYFLFSAPAFMKKWGPADEYGGHVRRYEKAELRARFKRHGFKITRFWAYGFPLTNMLDPISRIYYRRARKKRALSLTDATKRSGTERSAGLRLRKLPVAPLMAPFFWCQHVFREWNIGDGYVVLARKA